jgi:hypothetical protein
VPRRRHAIIREAIPWRQNYYLDRRKQGLNGLSCSAGSAFAQCHIAQRPVRMSERGDKSGCHETRRQLDTMILPGCVKRCRAFFILILDDAHTTLPFSRRPRAGLKKPGCRLLVPSYSCNKCLGVSSPQHIAFTTCRKFESAQGDGFVYACRTQSPG